jgi:hypothetical protein
MSPTGPAPQFSTAEYASTGETCKSCKQPISGNYYRINGMLACERCAQQVQQQMPKDSHAAFVKAITFGIGAAVLGCALFAGFVIVTHISLGYVALAVGWLIAKAMKFGSGGIGGRRYQIVAAVLTYAAVSVARVPIEVYFGALDLHISNLADVGQILLVGLASPFLRLQQNGMAVIGLIILFVGIRIAWQMMAAPALSVIGPFESKAASALPSATT